MCACCTAVIIAMVFLYCVLVHFQSFAMLVHRWIDGTEEGTDIEVSVDLFVLYLRFFLALQVFL
jgi:hypothetical protein